MANRNNPFNIIANPDQYGLNNAPDVLVFNQFMMSISIYYQKHVVHPEVNPADSSLSDIIYDTAELSFDSTISQLEKDKQEDDSSNNNNSNNGSSKDSEKTLDESFKESSDLLSNQLNLLDEDEKLRVITFFQNNTLYFENFYHAVILLNKELNKNNQQQKLIKNHFSRGEMQQYFLCLMRLMDQLEGIIKTNSSSPFIINPDKPGYIEQALFDRFKHNGLLQGFIFIISAKNNYKIDKDNNLSQSINEIKTHTTDNKHYYENQFLLNFDLTHLALTNNIKFSKTTAITSGIAVVLTASLIIGLNFVPIIGSSFSAFITLEFAAVCAVTAIMTSLIVSSLVALVTKSVGWINSSKKTKALAKQLAEDDSLIQQKQIIESEKNKWETFSELLAPDEAESTESANLKEQPESLEKHDVFNQDRINAFEETANKVYNLQM